MSDRPLFFIDASKGSTIQDELGRFSSQVVSVIEEIDDLTGRRSKTRDAYLQPRNWLLTELDKLGDSEVTDRRLSVALIADAQNDAGAWKKTPDGQPWNPLTGDWSGKNRSTRIVDADAPGRSALLTSIVQVVDGPRPGHVAALVLGRDTGAKAALAGGCYLDEKQSGGSGGSTVSRSGGSKRLGLLDTIFRTNKNDELGKGQEGTPYGLGELRHDVHFGHVGGIQSAAGSGGTVDKSALANDDGFHGALYFDTTDVSKVPEPSGLIGTGNKAIGVQLKGRLAFDPSKKNDDSENKHEGGKWRPTITDPYVTPEHAGQVGDFPGVAGGSSAGKGDTLALNVSSNPPGTDSVATYARSAQIAVSEGDADSSGERIIWVRQSDGTWKRIKSGSSATGVGLSMLEKIITFPYQETYMPTLANATPGVGTGYYDCGIMFPRGSISLGLTCFVVNALVYNTNTAPRFMGGDPNDTQYRQWDLLGWIRNNQTGSSWVGGAIYCGTGFNNSTGVNSLNDHFVAGTYVDQTTGSEGSHRPGTINYMDGFMRGSLHGGLPSAIANGDNDPDDIRIAFKTILQTNDPANGPTLTDGKIHVRSYFFLPPTPTA